MVVNWNERKQGSGAQGARSSVEHRGTFLRPSVCPSLPLQAISGLKSALSGLKPILSGLKSDLSGLKSERTGFRQERADFRPQRADSWPERSDFKPMRANFRPKRADFRPERADIRPERADFRPERTDFRSERVDFRPERAWEGQMKGRMDESLPVFYRTLSPSGLLHKKWKKMQKLPLINIENWQENEKNVEIPSNNILALVLILDIVEL